VARRDTTAGLGLPLDAGERWLTETYPPAALGEAPSTARKTRVRLPPPPLRRVRSLSTRVFASRRP